MVAAPRAVVEDYFRCMQAGATAADELLGLFAEDAVYVEPFQGAPRAHAGRAAIEAALRGGWETAPPQLVLTVDRIDVDGAVVVTDWTCTSPAFPGPMRGRDRCTVADGRIVRLEVTLLP